MTRHPQGEDRRVDAVAKSGARPPLNFVSLMLEAQRRERQHVLQEVLKAKGLMPLRRKQRNGSRWTTDERRQLREQLGALSRISPYLVALAVPGSLLMIPVLAWWLDRRRGKRN